MPLTRHHQLEILQRITPSCAIASFAAQPRCLSRGTAYGPPQGTGTGEGVFQDMNNLL